MNKLIFILSNYTYTTIQIDDEYMSFEAGFGNENFGEFVAKNYHYTLFFRL